MIKALQALAEMENNIKKRERWLHMANRVSTMLLMADAVDKFDTSIKECFELIGSYVDVDRIHLWRNEKIDGKPYFVHRYRWLSETGKKKPEVPFSLEFPHGDKPEWESMFVNNGYINGPISLMPPYNQDYLGVYAIKSIFIIPLFLHEKVWGLFSLDDCRRERFMSEEEIRILRSVGLLISNSISKYEMTQRINATNAKLDAVIKNYAGIIWSVDREGIITLFKGTCLKTLGIKPEYIEGKRLDDAFKKGWHLDIIENVKKAFNEGAQEWVSNIGVKKFHARAVPVYDEKGQVSGVVGSINDLTEIIELQDQLAGALAEAKRASRAKSVFLANMSHEIRTPINAIKGMVTIGSAALEAGRKDYCFAKIDDAVEHLLGVINCILDMSKIEAGKFTLSLREFNFEQMLQRVVNVVNFKAVEKRQNFSVTLDGKIPAVLLGDDQQLAQVITNLAGNAIKFTPEKGTVRIGARYLGERDGLCLIKVSVRDTGIGISPEHQVQLFQPFQQAVSNTTRKYGGTGLGLTISKSIVEMMGGKIWVESELGRGAEFSFTFPARRGQSPKTGFNQHKPTRERPLELAGLLKGRRILLAEDIAINREIVTVLLEPTLSRIDCAENGVEAVRMFSETPEEYDMIFMDVQMPEMDGYEATRRIRALDFRNAKSIPIIAMTANVFREDVEKCLAAGMDAHIGKPFSLDEVVETIQRFIA